MMSVPAEIRRDFSFAASYELPNVLFPVAYFPIISGDGTRDLAIEFLVNASRWCGVFRAGDSEAYGLFTCPNSDEICVLAGGRVSIVNVARGTTHGACQYELIASVTPILEKRLLVLATDTGMIAYGEDGEIWRSGQICLDELRVEGGDGQFVYASCWDPVSDGQRKFRVDASTGVPVDYEMP
jgi:hypothetical protein